MQHRANHYDPTYSLSIPSPTKKLIISAPNLPSGDAREKALSRSHGVFEPCLGGLDDKFIWGILLNKHNTKFLLCNDFVIGQAIYNIFFDKNQRDFSASLCPSLWDRQARSFHFPLSLQGSSAARTSSHLKRPRLWASDRLSCPLRVWARVRGPCEDLDYILAMQDLKSRQMLPFVDILIAIYIHMIEQVWMGISSINHIITQILLQMPK